MSILLTAINAKYIHSNLAVYSLRAGAGPYREQVEIAEFTINNQKDYILEEIYKRHPQVLCLSVYIWNLPYVESTAREFHKICPQVPIWVGGPEVSYEVENFLKEHPYITGIMMGEGEATFRDLCAYYLEKDPSIRRSLHEIPGLAFREAAEMAESAKMARSKIVISPPRQPVDMSTIPFAYDTTGDFSNRIIYYESSRGCPFSCSYCLSSVDKHLRFRDLDLVRQELLFFIEQKVPQIKFVDRTFNCNHSHAMEIWRFIKEHDNGITNFHFEISADLLNEEELNLISDMRPGLIQLEIGVQSTNEVTIQEIHRTMKLNRLKEIVGQIRQGNNIHQHLDLIAGLPYEDYDSFRRSFDEIYALKPNQLQLGFLKVLKGSFMYEHAKEYGLVYREEPPYEVLQTNWISYEDLIGIRRVEEMLEVYYNSGQYEITMKVLEVLWGSAFDFFRELGDYYEERGYMGMSHSRIRRCEILLEFMKRKAPERAAMLQEALTYDLYYRENCKSRPAWAPDPSSFKELTRKYCRQGKVSHLEPFHYRFPEKDVLTIGEIPERLEEPVYVLFHYDRRDPLDHQATTEYI